MKPTKTARLPQASFRNPTLGPDRINPSFGSSTSSWHSPMRTSMPGIRETAFGGQVSGQQSSERPAHAYEYSAEDGRAVQMYEYSDQAGGRAGSGATPPTGGDDVDVVLYTTDARRPSSFCPSTLDGARSLGGAIPPAPPDDAHAGKGGRSHVAHQSWASTRPRAPQASRPVARLGRLLALVALLPLHICISGPAPCPALPCSGTRVLGCSLVPR